jgi:hypothetical protein
MDYPFKRRVKIQLNILPEVINYKKNYIFQEPSNYGPTSKGSKPFWVHSISIKNGRVQAKERERSNVKVMGPNCGFKIKWSKPYSTLFGYCGWVREYLYVVNQIGMEGRGRTSN